MKNFQRLNNILGWLVFGIAAFTYGVTVEPTASFWDCGEFIATAYKLQVPHPPGAPFFLLIGRLFSLFAGDDVTKVAYYINMVSVLTSAFSIMFLFWTISLLARKIMGKVASELSTTEVVTVLGASLIGALTYTFTDSFWFSAVEAEVYGMSSFFTAIVVWAAFKWETVEDEATANRWILFIAYLTGLSIGVHLLNLVTIPAIALIYYFKKNKTINWKGGILAFLGGMVILGFIYAFIIPGIPSIAQNFELLFVNTLGMPFNSGGIFFLVTFVSAIVFGVYYTQKTGKVIANVAMLSLTFILIGYCSYLMILVRSNFNPPINENDPSNLLNYTYYLKREQYGSRSLSYGPIYTAQATGVKQGKALYNKGKDKYEIYKHESDYDWAPGSQMLFPRVWSSDPNHIQLYQQMLKIPEGARPSMGKNLSFFFSHQIHHMYFRYFMWNFAGRESDEEGAYWTTPLTSNKDIPEALAKNKGRSNYYWLPFLLGLVGFVYHYMKRERDWFVLFLLFLFTGIGLVVFLNSPPVEPRERDYIYVASFYFYAIWIGVGVMAVAEGLKKVLGKGIAAPALATVLALSLPVILATQNWKNHDRSGRYHQVDFAKNLLNSCAPNAILFTGGDNDTFSLWYAQEVEGFRTDVRVCNLSLLGTSWYIEQMKRKTYQSEALPISLTMPNFREGVNSYLQFMENPNVAAGMNLSDYLNLVETQNSLVTMQSQGGENVTIFPTKNFTVNYNPEEIKKMGFVGKEFEQFLSGSMNWSIDRELIMKPDLIMLDIIANNNWKRPIYFAGTLATENYLNLKDHMQLEGYSYRLMPFRIEGAKEGFMDSEVAYDKLLKKTFWRGTADEKVYYDTETYLKVPIITARYAFLRLADQLNREGKKEKMLEVLDFSQKVLPDKTIPYDQIAANYPTFYYEAGQPKKALEISDVMVKRADEILTYYSRNSNAISARDAQIQVAILQLLADVTKQNNQPEAAKRYEDIVRKHSGQ